MNTSLPLMTQPIDRVVEIFNSLSLTIIENKKTLTRWMDNLFETMETLEKKVDKNNNNINKDLDNIVKDIYTEIYDNNDIYKVKEECFREIEILRKEIKQMKKERDDKTAHNKKLFEKLNNNHIELLPMLVFSDSESESESDRGQLDIPTGMFLN